MLHVGKLSLMQTVIIIITEIIIRLIILFDEVSKYGIGERF
jgi:hypothetical protein